MALTPTTVLSRAEITITLTPKHGFRKSDHPTLTVHMPPDYGVLLAPTCKLTRIKNLGAKAFCKSDKIKHALTISEMVDKDFPGGTQLSFKIGYFTNPYTVDGGLSIYDKHNKLNPGMGGGGIRIQTYVQPTPGLKVKRYAVDDGSVFGHTLYALTSGSAKAKVIPKSFDALVKTEYTFQVTPEHVMPQYALFMVVYPKELVIQDQYLSQSMCKGWKKFPSKSAVCTIF